MKQFIICSLAILLLFTGCKRCGKDECLGDYTLWLNVTAQAPREMSYQAVIRDNIGNLVTNRV